MILNLIVLKCWCCSYSYASYRMILYSNAQEAANADPPAANTATLIVPMSII